MLCLTIIGAQIVIIIITHCWGSPGLKRTYSSSLLSGESENPSPAQARAQAVFCPLHGEPKTMMKGDLKKKTVFWDLQWLRLHMSTPGGRGSIPGWWTEVPHPGWCGQKIKRISFKNSITQKMFSFSVEIDTSLLSVIYYCVTSQLQMASNNSHVFIMALWVSNLGWAQPHSSPGLVWVYWWVSEVRISSYDLSLS